LIVGTGASLGSLSSGRVTITMICAQYMSAALTIAIRYSAVRKQFGPIKDNELPVIEYQSQVCIYNNDHYMQKDKYHYN
jgi:acyl-CoA oxidase